MSTKPKAAKAAITFTDEQRRELLQHGLSLPQVEALARKLPAIWEWLRPLPRSKDVMDELQSMASEIEACERRLKKWRQARTAVGREPSAYAEALGHFNISAGPLVRLPGSSVEVHLVGDSDPAKLFEILAGLCRNAVKQAPTKQRRNPRASPEAIRLIHEALRVPKDAESQGAMEKLNPSRYGPFAAVAGVVWCAVLGDSGGSPEHSIRRFNESTGEAAGDEHS